MRKNQGHPVEPAETKQLSERMLITVKDLARMLSVSERSVWRLVSAGRIPIPIKIGSFVRWHRDEIEHWIQQGCP